MTLTYYEDHLKKEFKLSPTGDRVFSFDSNPTTWCINPGGDKLYVKLHAQTDIHVYNVHVSFVHMFTFLLIGLQSGKLKNKIKVQGKTKFMIHPTRNSLFVSFYDQDVIMQIDVKVIFISFVRSSDLFQEWRYSERV